MYDFERRIQRKGTYCFKWDTMERNFHQSDMIPMGLADMDFAVMPAVQKAMKKRCKGAFGYDFPAEKYYGSIIEWYERRHNLTLEKENILDVPGVLIALCNCIEAFTKEGDKVLINPPVYHLFAKAVNGLNRTLVNSPLINENGFYRLDMADIEKKLRGGVKAYLLCSPHNPVGRTWTEEELYCICELCKKYNVKLIVDEIHSDIVFKGSRHISVFNAHPEAKKIAVSVCSPSKPFNFAGLKVANIYVFDPEMRERIMAEINKRFIEVNTLGWVATQAAYENGDAWIDELMECVEKNTDYVISEFKRCLPKVRLVRPQATYLLWIDFSAYGLSQEELMRVLNREAKVILNDGTVFGEGGCGFARMNVGTSPKTVIKAVNSICKAFAAYSCE